MYHRQYKADAQLHIVHFILTSQVAFIATATTCRLLSCDGLQLSKQCMQVGSHTDSELEYQDRHVATSYMYIKSEVYNLAQAFWTQAASGPSAINCHYKYG